MKNYSLMLSIIVLTIFTLIACNNENNSLNASSFDGEQILVEVFNIKVETRDQLEDLVRRYEYLNPHVKIEVMTVGGGTDAPAALQARFASGNEPAIFMLGGIADALLWQDHLLDVSGTHAANMAIEGTLEGAMIDGVPLGLPYNIEGFAWLINLDIFERAGIEPDSIQSFGDFESVVRQIDSMADELGIDAVFAFSGGEYWVVSQFSSHFSSVAHDNNLAAVATAETFYLGEVEDLFKAYIDLINEFSIEPIITVDYGLAVEDLFVNNRVAMTHQGNWVVPTLDGIDPTFTTTRMGILPFFISDSGNTATIAAGPSWFWGINSNKDEAVIEESINFLNWMYTSPEGKERMITDFGFIPAYNGNDTNLITDPVSRQIYTSLEAGDITPWSHNSYPAGWSANSLFPQWQRYVAGELNWEEFMETISNSWEELR